MRILCAALLLVCLLDWLVFQGEHMRWLALGAAILMVVITASDWRRSGTNA